jgi:hypothetical protein
MEQAALIKGRLILINSVKVDGELVYTRPESEPFADAEQQQHEEAGSTDGIPAARAPEARQPQGQAPRPQAQRRPFQPGNIGNGQPSNRQYGSRQPAGAY